MLQTLYSALLTAHIATGIFSLMLFWVPILSRKGGVNHRKIGNVYVKLMWIVVITAASMSLINLASGRIIQAIFLGFLSLLTAKPLWLGISVLNKKRTTDSAFERQEFILNTVLAIAGAAMIGYGISLSGQTVALLMMAFGGLGMLGLPDVFRTLRQKESNTDSLHSHIGDMIVSGIAAYTAFFAFGASQFTAAFISGTWVTIPWLAPTVIGSIGIFYARSRYGRKAVPETGANTAISTALDVKMSQVYILDETD